MVNVKEWNDALADSATLLKLLTPPVKKKKPEAVFRVMIR
jgi:hypothetical protein